MVQEKNVSCITQLNLLILYSLIMRYEGSYSGFSMCKVASNTKNNAAAQNDMRAVVIEISIIGLIVVVFMNSFCNVLLGAQALSTARNTVPARCHSQPARRSK